MPLYGGLGRFQGVDGYDWAGQNRRQGQQPVIGIQASTTPQSNPGVICGRALDDTVVVGGVSGIPITPNSVGAGSLGGAAYVAPQYAASPAPGGTTTQLSGLACRVDVTCSVNNVPQDGSVAKVLWAFRRHGDTAWTPWAETTIPGFPYPSTTEGLSFTYAGLDNGVAYDFGCCYVSVGGEQGAVSAFLTNYAVSTIQIPGTYLVGGTPVTPTLTGASVTPAGQVTGVTSAVTVAFTATNQPTDGSLARIGLWYRKTGDTAWTPYGGSPATSGSSASYSEVLADITNGIGYDFGMTFIGLGGQESNVALVGSISAPALSIGTNFLKAGSGTAPTVSGVTTSSASSASGLTTDFEITFSITNQPADNSGIKIAYFVVTQGGSLANGIYSEVEMVAGASYAPNFTGLHNGAAYTFGVAFVYTNGQYGSITTLGTFTMPTIGVPSSYLLGGTSITPSIVSPSLSFPMSTNGVSAAATVSFSLNNQPTDGSLSRVSYYYRQTGTANWSFYSSQPAAGVGQASPPATGAYSFTYADLTNGVGYDFGVSYENAQGGESSIAVITSATAQQLTIPTSALATMGSGQGISIVSASYGSFANAGQPTAQLPFTATFNDWSAGNAPAWFLCVRAFLRLSGSGSTSGQPLGDFIPGSGTTTITGTAALAAGGTFDIGFAFVDNQGNLSSVAWPAGTSNIVVPGINGPAAIVGATGTANMVPDSPFAFLDTSGYTNTSHLAYWTGAGGPIAVWKGGSQLSYGPGSPTSLTGSVCSEQIGGLVVGQPYTFSIQFTNTGTGGNIANLSAGIVDPGQSGNATPTFLSGASVSCSTSVSNKTYTVTWTATQTTVCIALAWAWTNQNISIFISYPMLQAGSTFTGYVAGPASTGAGQQSHSASSPQTQQVIANNGGNGQLTVNPAGGTVGVLPFNNHHSSVTSTLMASAGTDGSYLNSSVVNSRQISNGTILRQHMGGYSGMGGNILYNPTFAQGTAGWAVQFDTSGGISSWGQDNYMGGRLRLSMHGTAPTNANYGWAQDISARLSPGVEYTLSGFFEVGSLSGPISAQIDVWDATASGYAGGYYSITANGSGEITPFSFTAVSGHTYYVRVLVGTSGGSVSIDAYFHKLKLEVGSVATPFTDDLSAALVTNTHDASAGGDGSFLRSSTVFGRHINNGQIVNSHFGSGATIDGIGDGSTYGRPLLARLSSGKPWIDFSEAIHLNKNLDNVGDGSTSQRYAVSAIDGSRRALIDYAQSGHLNTLPLTKADPELQHLQTRNLIRNGLWTIPDVVYPAYGWQAVGGGGGVAMSVLQNAVTVNGQLFPALKMTAANSGYGIMQQVNLQPGVRYSYACCVYFPSAGATANVEMTDVARSVAFTPSAVEGTVPAFYSALVGANVVTGMTTSTSGAWVLVSGSFVVPNGYASGLFNITLYPGTSDLYVFAPMVWQGGKWQDYDDAPTHVFDHNGYINGSTAFNSQGAFLNVAGTPSSTYSSSTSSVTISIPAATYTRTDRSTVSVGAYSNTWSGLAASTTYYWDIYYDVVNNVFGCAFYNTTAPTKAQQLSDCYADGRIDILASYSITTPSSGTGGGSVGGGGGSTPSCPAEHQPMLTKERGVIRADEIDLGMHIPGPGPDGWVEVTEATRLRAPLWRFAITDGESVEEFDVNDTHALRGIDEEWHKVRDLKAGDRIRGRDGNLTVVYTRYLRDGYYIALEVEEHLYWMGEALVHNPITL